MNIRKKLLQRDERLTSDTSNGFTACQISDVNKGIVESGVNVRNGKDIFAGSNILGAESGFLLGSSFLLLAALKKN
jgi:hypothetical protein